MNWVGKNWPSVLILLAGIAAAVGSYVSSNRDGAQKDKIQKLGEENLELSNKISELQKLNTTLLDTINKRAAYVSEENLQTGKLEINFYRELKDNDVIKVILGSSAYSTPVIRAKNGAFPVTIGNQTPLTFTFDKTNSLLLNLKVYDYDGNLIAEIENNYWRPNRNFTGKFNYDNRGFEVIDNKGNIAVNVNITDKNEIIIYGVFQDRESNSTMILGAEHQSFMSSANPDDAEIKKAIRKARIKQLFEYTGPDWLHKRKR